MNVKEIIEYIRDTIISIRCVIIKYNPIRYPVGLIECGHPSLDSPVFVSCNYYQTVVRLKHCLKNIDCRILVVDSAGINVWCAAGVGDFNEHKIADAIFATGLFDQALLNHKKLILPQLSAVGIDLKKLKEITGFTGIWGPADLEDIPRFISNEFKTDSNMRTVRFSVKDRFFNAIGMFNVFLIFPFIFTIFKKKKQAHHLFLINFFNIFITFLLYPFLPFKYGSFKSIFAGFLSFLFRNFIKSVTKKNRNKNLSQISEKGITIGFDLFWSGLITFLIAIDMLGSTPFFKTTIMNWFKTGNDESIFQPEITSSCIGCGRCEQVCPKNMFRMSKDKTKKRVALLNNQNSCCECMACVKQCPVYAIKNRNNLVYKEDIKSIPDLEAILNGTKNRLE